MIMQDSPGRILSDVADQARYAAVLRQGSRVARDDGIDSLRVLFGPVDVDADVGGSEGLTEYLDPSLLYSM